MHIAVSSPEDTIPMKLRSESQTEPGRLIGTLKYMSPEELHGEKPAESVSPWVVLYYWLYPADRQ